MGPCESPQSPAGHSACARWQETKSRSRSIPQGTGTPLGHSAQEGPHSSSHSRPPQVHGRAPGCLRPLSLLHGQSLHAQLLDCRSVEVALISRETARSRQGSDHGLLKVRSCTHCHLLSEISLPQKGRPERSGPITISPARGNHHAVSISAGLLVLCLVQTEPHDTRPLRRGVLTSHGVLYTHPCSHVCGELPRF